MVENIQPDKFGLIMLLVVGKDQFADEEGVKNKWI